MTATRALRTAVSDAGAATRERILDAAEALFAAEGFSASVRQITADAACNLASISYHFGGKEPLYEEVFRRRLEPLREQRLRRIAAFVDDSGERLTLVGLLDAYTAAFLESWAESPSGSAFMRLLSREIVEPHLPAGFLAAFFEPIHDALSGALMRCCPGLAPADARLSGHAFLALLGNVLSAHRAYGPQSGGVSLDVSALAEHTVRLLSGGIKSLARPAVRRQGRHS